MQVCSQAENILEVYKSSIPVDPARVAKTLSMEVKENIFDRAALGFINGAVDHYYGQSEILLNELSHPNQKRFICAYLIGYVLERQQKETDFKYACYQNLVGWRGDDFEKEASSFAFSLMMPSHAVKQSIICQSDEVDMINRFGVPGYVVNERLQELGYAL